MIDFEEAPDFVSSPRRFGSGSGSDFGAPGSFTRKSGLKANDPNLPGFLAKLNPPQREAATTVDGPLIVLAGAGSGKTRMVTARIAHLIGYCGVPARHILAVTFTNKAAEEMKSRVDRALDEVAHANAGYSGLLGGVEIGTFHAVCTRILRRELDRTPFKKNFVIYDDSDQLSLIKSVMKKLDLDPKAYNPKAIQGAINLAKCDAHEPHEVPVTSRGRFDRVFREVYEEYQKELVTASAVDFGEILCLTYRILRDHEDVRRKYQDRFRFIHVDEYQDTNRAQYLLLSVLASPKFGGHQNICVVGDEDQSIYKWRGADIHNILDFESEYPQAKLVKLEQNYRSTKTIITASSQLISNNSERKDKRLWTDNETGMPLTRYQFRDERAEAEGVVAEIKKQVHEGGFNFEEMAIFYRTHAQSRQFEDILRREKISYQVVGGLRFYDRKEIKDVLAYLRVVLNPADSVSLRRIINVPTRGIGKQTLNRLDQMLQDMEGETLWSIIEKVTEKHWVFSARPAAKMRAFVEIVRKLQAAAEKVPLSELYHLILEETGYVRDLRKEDTIESHARIENLEEFDSMLAEYEESLPEELAQKPERVLPNFLERISLATSADQTADPQSVKLMTFHAAKGLEFPVVFMVGMEEGLFPSTLAWEETPQEEIEEERRLCYVGMTRARKLLYLCHGQTRRLRGEMNFQEPARFFEEISPDLMQTVNLAHSVGGDSEAPRGRFGSDKPDWTGFQVNHPQYGEGTIISSEGHGPSEKVTIEFKGRVKKKFLLRYLLNLVS